MKVTIVGAGPAGLYFAILTKKANPGASIAVYERNRVNDTFGFGVVFSDQTLDNFEVHDAESYDRITRAFAYWDDIEINFKGTQHRIGGNGFCGCSRRTLLLILYERAKELGVEVIYETEIDDIEAFARESDLVVLADGINSKFRDRYKDHFQLKIDLRPNKFSWMGSTTRLDAFKFAFEETGRVSSSRTPTSTRKALRHGYSRLTPTHLTAPGLALWTRRSRRGRWRRSSPLISAASGC